MEEALKMSGSARKRKKIDKLEELVLGDGSSVFKKLSDAESTDEEENIEVIQKEPAWVDDNDKISFGHVVKIQKRKCKPGLMSSKEYQTVMEDKYKGVMGVPNWAKPSSSKKKKDSFLATSGSFVKKAKSLEKGRLEFKKMKDLNQETYTEGPLIKVVKFHPKSTVGMVAGISGVVSLFHVDGKQNSKLQSIQFNRYPINCGSFLNSGEELLVGSQNYSFFFSHNMITGQSSKVNLKSKCITNTKNFIISPDDKFIVLLGKFGNIYLLAASSKEVVATFKMNCDVLSADFNVDGSKLYTHGADGEVYIWDMPTRQCIFKFIDEGCLSGTAISADNQFVACGSSSGIINIYETDKVLTQSVSQPSKVISNLVTSVSCVKFNPSNEILAIASSYKENAVKLVHCASMSVFANFPALHTKLNRPQCLDFSPNSGYFAFGDNKGTAHLYRLKYYGNY